MESNNLAERFIEYRNSQEQREVNGKIQYMVKGQTYTLTESELFSLFIKQNSEPKRQVGFSEGVWEFSDYRITSRKEDGTLSFIAELFPENKDENGRLIEMAPLMFYSLVYLSELKRNGTIFETLSKVYGKTIEYGSTEWRSLYIEALEYLKFYYNQNGQKL